MKRRGQRVDKFGRPTAIPAADREAHRRQAPAAAAVFRARGALRLLECGGEDAPDGKLTSFPMAVKRRPDETVVFSWVFWPSRAVRGAGMKKVMVDPRVRPDVNPMPCSTASS